MRLPGDRLDLEELSGIILYASDPDDGDLVPDLGELADDVFCPQMILPRTGREWDDGVLDLFRRENGRVECWVRVDGVLRNSERGVVSTRSLWTRKVNEERSGTHPVRRKSSLFDDNLPSFRRRSVERDEQAVYVGRQRRGVSDFGFFGSCTSASMQGKIKQILISYGLMQRKRARRTYRPAGPGLEVRIGRYPSKVYHEDEQSDHRPLCIHRIVIVKCPRSDG